MAQREHEPEAAEADALQGGVCRAAGARRNEASSPPRLQHRVASEAAAAGSRGQAAEEIRERPAHEEQNRHPERNQAADGEEREEEIFNDAIAENIQLRAR